MLIVRNILVLNNFSNILLIPKFSQLYEAFAYKILSKKTKFKLDAAEEKAKVEERNALVSFIENPLQFPQRKISEIRFDDKKFWMNCYLVASPHGGSLINWYDEASNKSYEDSKKAKGTPYFNVQLMVSDEEFGSSTLKLYLCSYDGNGEGLLGSAADCAKNDKKARELLKKLADQKNYMQVLVEAVQTGPEASDKIFRIIGKYELK